MPEIMGKYLLCQYLRGAAELFHLRPDSAPVQGFAGLRNEYTARFDSMLFYIAFQRLAKLFRQQNCPGLSFASDGGFPLANGFYGDKRML